MNTTKDWAVGIGVVVGIAAAIALGLGIGDKMRSNSYLFVDNAGAEPAVVKLDGEVALSVPPGSVGVVYTRHGDRQIRVERGGQPVFEKQVNLESPGFYGVNKYIVNPKQESGYWVRTIVYGSNVPNINFQAPLPDDPTELYARIAREVNLLNNAEWWLVPSDKSDYVLTETPPETISVSEGQKSVTKYHVFRMERSEYDLVQAAPEKKHVSEAELEKLRVIVGAIFTKEEQRLP